MINLSKAYNKAKNFIAKSDEYNDCGVYFYIELNKVYAFLIGIDKNNCFDKKVLTVNKEGGKVNQFTMHQLTNYFYEYDYEKLIEINNPDFLGNNDLIKEDIFIAKNVDDLNKLLDFNEFNKFSENDYIYNLVEMGETYRTVEKIRKLGLTLQNIPLIGFDGFTKVYGKQKKKLFTKIYEILNNKELNESDVSIYALIPRGVHNLLCDKLVELGIDKIYKLYLIPREIFATKFNMLVATVNTIYDALEKMDFELSTNENVKNYVEVLQKDKSYCKIVKSEIHKIISESDKPIKPLRIKSEICNRFSYVTIINDLIDELIEEGIISLTEVGLKANLIRLKDYLNYLPDNDVTKLARKYFLNNETTLQSLGDELKVSREYVRQIINKVTIPTVYEHKYIKYFTKYEFNSKSFSEIFNEETYIYKFLLHLCGKKTGTIKIEYMLDDEEVEDEYKSRIEEYLKDKFLFINGEKIYKSKVKLLEYYMKHNVTKLTHVDDIKDGFNHFIDQNISDFGKIENVRDIESPISDDNFPSLKTNRHQYKYVDIKSEDTQKLITFMDLDRYKDIELSAKYLFDLHFEYMKEFDIENEYVLHNLLKKTYCKDGVDYQRSPYINFGKGDRKKQIEELIYEYAPIDVADLAQKYSEMYGALVKTIKVFIETEFKSIINGQIVSLVGNHDFSDDEVNLFSSILSKKEIWFKEDIYEECNKINVHVPNNLFAWQNMEKVGFHNASNYIYSNNYESMKDYLEKNYFSKDFQDTNLLDRRMIYVVVFSNMIIEKRKNLDIIEYESGKFMKYSVLKKANINKNDLIDFIQKIYEFTINKGLFTIKSIKNQGFNHYLFDLGFEDVFYSSILRNSNDFIFKRYGNQTLFENTKEEKEISTADILVNTLFKFRKMEEYELAEYIEEIYGLDYKEKYYKLQEYAKKAGVYYDKYNDVYYYDYETYYEEM